MAGQYDESLKITRACERIWADYDLQLLIAENYLQCREYSRAEYHYRQASFMCPVRFVPLYFLYRLYGITGEREKQLMMANEILDKPVKVMSPAVEQIKEEVKQIMNYDL